MAMRGLGKAAFGKRSLDESFEAVRTNNDETDPCDGSGSGVVACSSLSRLTRKVMLLSRPRSNSLEASSNDRQPPHKAFKLLNGSNSSSNSTNNGPSHADARTAKVVPHNNNKSFLQQPTRVARRDPATMTFVDLMEERSRDRHTKAASRSTAQSSYSIVRGQSSQGGEADTLKLDHLDNQTAHRPMKGTTERELTNSTDCSGGVRSVGSNNNSGSNAARVLIGGMQATAPIYRASQTTKREAVPERVCHLDKKRKLDEMVSMDSDDVHAVMHNKSARQALECTVPLSPRHLKIRKVLINWMFESGDNLHLNPLTVHCAVHNFDRVLRVVAIDRNVVQLVGLTCLMLAAKIDEVESELPSTEELLSFAPSGTTKAMFIAMEITLLEKLHWQLSVVTPRHFVDLYVARGCLFHNDTTTTNTISSSSTASNRIVVKGSDKECAVNNSKNCIAKIDNFAGHLFDSESTSCSCVIAGGGDDSLFANETTACSVASIISNTNVAVGEKASDAKTKTTIDNANPSPEVVAAAKDNYAVVQSSELVPARAAVGVTPIRKVVLGNSKQTSRAFVILTRVLCEEVLREARFLVLPPALLAAGIVWAGRVALGVSPPWRPELSALTLERNEESVKQVGDDVFAHLSVVRPELIVQSGNERDETCSPKGVADLLLSGE